MNVSADIDSFDPTLILKDIMWGNTRYAHVPHHWHLSNGLRGGTIRVRHKKLLDWRSLERRLHFMQSQYDATWNVVWSKLQELHAQAGATGASDVWVHIEKDPTYVLVYDGEGICNESVNCLVKQYQKQPRKKALVVDKETSLFITRTYDRAARWQRMLHMYRSVFVHAVQARLKKFIEPQKSSGRYVPSETFLVKNEGRTYVFRRNNYGTLEFLDSKVTVFE